jgi:hypothetical protein
MKSAWNVKSEAYKALKILNVITWRTQLEVKILEATDRGLQYT